MTPPFEVAAPRSELYSGLLALSKATAARGVYELPDLRRHVVSFFRPQTFHDLADAVAAALCAGSVVRVLRDATLPGPPTAFRARNCAWGTWCPIPPGTSVTIASKGRPCRLRHFGDASDSLFAICNGATLTVSGLKFEALLSKARADRAHAAGGVHFATVMPDQDLAGRLKIAGEVTFAGYDDVVHRATAREADLFEQLS